MVFKRDVLVGVSQEHFFDSSVYLLPEIIWRSLGSVFI